MRKTTLLLTIICGSGLAISAKAARIDSLAFKPQTVLPKRTGGTAPAPANARFVYQDRNGNTASAPIVEKFRKDRIVHPVAKIDPKLDPSLARAATIADERARAHSRSRCWRYVKEALLASGAVDSYPKTRLAKHAGDELVRDFGFKKLPIRDPYAAPIGAVLVYSKGRSRAGHVVIRTRTGFVSDYSTKNACEYALLGVYGKKG